MSPVYGRVYGYLHDDLTRRRPSLQLALELERRHRARGPASGCCSTHEGQCSAGSS